MLLVGSNLWGLCTKLRKLLGTGGKCNSESSWGFTAKLKVHRLLCNLPKLRKTLPKPQNLRNNALQWRRSLEAQETKQNHPKTQKMHRLISSRSAAAKAVAAAAAAVSIAATAEFAYADERGPSSSGGFDPEALEKGAKALREINSSRLAKQVFDHLPQ